MQKRKYRNRKKFIAKEKNIKIYLCIIIFNYNIYIIFI